MASQRQKDALRRFRRRHDVTLQALAVNVGRSATWVHDVEQGYARCSSDDIRALRDAIQELSGDGK